MYYNCARDRVTPGELRWAGERPKRSRVIYHISEQTAKKSDGHFDPSLSLPLNGWLLSPEPVVVEVSPDPSASTMTGGAESSSLSGNRLASENAPSFGTNDSLVCGLSSRRLMKQSIRQASFFAGRG